MTLTRSLMESHMREFAEALKTQREAQGLTLDDLFRRTRINPEWLSAIEAGHFDILPPIYVRLFLKTYAREVGLDAEEVIKHYETIAPAPPPVQAPAQSKHRSSPVALIALGLIFVVAIGLVALQISRYVPEDPAMPLDMAAPPTSFQPPALPESAPESETGQTEENASTESPAPGAQPESQSPPIQGPMPEPQTLPAASPVPQSTPSTEPAPPVPQPVRPAPEPAPAEIERTQNAPAGQPQPLPSASPTPAAQPVALAEIMPESPPPEPAESRALTSYDMPLPADLSDQETLTLAGFVRENTQVSVYADGQMVFEGELRAGSQPRWQARDSFRLYIVRAGAIALSLQNQAFAPPSPLDQSLRLLVNRTRIRVEELALPPTDR